MKKILLICSLLLCSCVPLTYQNGNDYRRDNRDSRSNSNYNRYNCIETQYDYRDMATQIGYTATAHGDARTQYGIGFLGYLFDYMNPKNHNCPR